MAEFTGERIIPGKVDADLMNEHVARYHFASRLAHGKRVLDIGCGAGYGSAELARTALSVTGVDVSAEAVAFAQAHYGGPTLRFEQASAEALPHPDASFDLVVAFEIVEHLENWPGFLCEARRVLVPNGQFIVSTPNKLYYSESRRLTGPNPFHVHEFEYQEFRSALAEWFPHIALFVENHVAGVAFQPVEGSEAAEVRVEGGETSPEEAHFFMAVCAHRPQTGGPTFVYVPRAANMLREREHHIELLDQSLKEARARVVELQDENARQQEAAQQAITKLDDELRSKAEWALATSAELEAKCKELAHAVELLDKAEKLVEERTLWAKRLEAQFTEAEQQLAMYRASRWVRLGRRLNLGPRLPES